MDIQSRKLEFIQEFLKIQSEEVIAQFEKLLTNRKTESHLPFSIDELNQRIDKSESDFKNKNYKSSSELLSKFK